MKRCKLHTIFTLKALTAALWLVLASGMVSCADNGSPDEPEAPDTPLAELTLRVGALRSGDNRARSQSDEFEAPTFRHENIRFLRIIIVHPDGTVEHNRLLTFNGRTDQVSYTFKVTPGETKQIYIVGNEPISMESSLAGITVGSMFNKSMVEELMLSRATGVPLIDNTGTAQTWVPMSEHFEVKVIDITEGNKQTANLFVTRAAVKFSFSFKAGTDEIPYGGHGFEVSKIKISNIATTEYLFPHNTVYDPAKELPSDNPLQGRYITSYTTPATAAPTDFTYNVAIDAGSAFTQFSPAIYLPESSTGKYEISVAVREKDGNNGYLQSAPIWFGHKELDIKDLPRNTHVYINTTLTNSGIYPKVTIEPFKEIVLSPDFGF